MSVNKSATTMQKICTVIKRFKFDELEEVLLTFPEISWTTVKSELVKNHKSFTPANVCVLIELALIGAVVEERVLVDRLTTLEVLEVSKHNDRKKWYGYTMTGNCKVVGHIVNREVQNNIKHHFKSIDVAVDAKILTYDGITYLGIKEKKKKGKVQTGVATYFALFLGQKYFFCSRKGVRKDFVNIVALSIGYADCKRLNLVGKDLKSLSKMCWKKRQGALNSNNIAEAPVYRDAAPSINHSGIDYTQHKQRKKYAQACFGDDPPTLESVVIKEFNQPLASTCISSRLPYERLQVTWEFRSHNIATCFTNLIERRILVTPVPHYISNLMVLGKNVITLERD